MTPYYEQDGITIWHGDCRELIDSIEFDQIVTDPPYGIGYEIIFGDYDQVAGDQDTTLAEWVVNLGVPTVAFGANHYAAALPSVGRWICWDKRCNERADKMIGSPFELAWVSGDDRCGVMYRIQHGGVVNADGPNRRRVHPTQKPLTLMVRIISDHVDSGVILDPFMGSGTTLRAAKDLGRQAIGIEIEERYCEIAANRLAQGVLDLGQPL